MPDTALISKIPFTIRVTTGAYVAMAAVGLLLSVAVLPLAVKTSSLWLLLVIWIPLLGFVLLLARRRIVVTETFVRYSNGISSRQVAYHEIAAAAIQPSPGRQGWYYLAIAGRHGAALLRIGLRAYRPRDLAMLADALTRYAPDAALDASIAQLRRGAFPSLPRTPRRPPRASRGPI